MHRTLELLESHGLVQTKEFASAGGEKRVFIELVS